MIHIIHTLHEIFNLIKGLTPMHSAPQTGKMLLKRENDGVYLIKIEKVSTDKDQSIESFNYLLH